MESEFSSRGEAYCFIWSIDPGHNSNCLTCLMQKEIPQRERNCLTPAALLCVCVCICVSVCIEERL